MGHTSLEFTKRQTFLEGLMICYRHQQNTVLQVAFLNRHFYTVKKMEENVSVTLQLHPQFRHKRAQCQQMINVHVCVTYRIFARIRRTRV